VPRLPIPITAKVSFFIFDAPSVCFLKLYHIDSFMSSLFLPKTTEKFTQFYYFIYDNLSSQPLQHPFRFIIFQI